jgi:dihydropteroate synthase
MRSLENAAAMAHGPYLRPLGFLPSAAGRELSALKGVLPLAGGVLDFSAIEVSERSGTSATRRIAGLSDLADSEWGRHVETASAALDALVAPRPPLGRLTLDRPRIMGIVNVTPDSFSDGGLHATPRAAIDHALRLADEGADILDIGAESTRPGSDPVAIEEELSRVLPVIEALAGRTPALLSVDTRKAEVMRRAAAAGVDILNDISALTHDADALEVAAESGLPVVLMHALGDPKTMQDAPRYDDVLCDVFDYLKARIAACEGAGLSRRRLIVDPGIGFGKTLEHNLALMSGLALFHSLGTPILLGASRKSFIGRLTGEAIAASRVAGSVGAALAAAGQGAQILRVHDVRATRQALDVWLASLTGQPSGG